MIYVGLCTSHHNTKQRNTTLAPRTQETPQPGDQSGEGRRRWFALQGWWLHFTALKSFSVPLCINCVWGVQGSKRFNNKPQYSALITCHYIASHVHHALRTCGRFCTKSCARYVHACTGERKKPLRISLNASVQKQQALLLHSVLTQLQNTGTSPYRWERKRKETCSKKQ